MGGWNQELSYHQLLQRIAKVAARIRQGGHVLIVSSSHMLLVHNFELYLTVANWKSRGTMIQKEIESYHTDMIPIPTYLIGGIYLSQFLSTWRDICKI